MAALAQRRPLNFPLACKASCEVVAANLYAISGAGSQGGNGGTARIIKQRASEDSSIDHDALKRMQGVHGGVGGARGPRRRGCRHRRQQCLCQLAVLRGATATARCHTQDILRGEASVRRTRTLRVFGRGLRYLLPSTPTPPASASVAWKGGRQVPRLTACPQPPLRRVNTARARGESRE